MPAPSFVKRSSGDGVMMSRYKEKSSYQSERIRKCQITLQQLSDSKEIRKKEEGIFQVLTKSS